jgi:hypothetical protein
VSQLLDAALEVLDDGVHNGKWKPDIR